MRFPLACLAFLLGAGSGALAQQRMFTLDFDPESGVSSLWETRIDNGQLQWLDPRLVAEVGAAPSAPVVTAGGEMVVIASTPALIAFDRTNRAAYVLDGVERLGPSDPTRARLFVPAGTGVGELTAEGMRLLPGTDGLAPISVSSDGRRLFATRVAGTEAELEALEAATGARLWTVPLGSYVSQVIPASDEASAWVLTRPNIGPPMLRQLALPSGAELLAFPPAASIGMVRELRLIGVDTVRGRVFVSVTAGITEVHSSGYVRTFDASTGALLANVSVEGLSYGLIDSAADALLVYSTHQVVTNCRASFRLLSASTGQERSNAFLGVSKISCPGVAFAAPPSPPRLSPPVTTPNGSVALSWERSPELTAGFTVEAGSAPGLSNLGSFPVTNGTTLTVPNVPPGAYYVRIRAWNYIGASVPSNEATVTVP